MSQENLKINNFGIIKNTFNNILVEGIITKNEPSKKLFKDYIKTIKESEILKTQFIVYSNIENKIESDVSKATLFVKENIELFSKFKKGDIIKENNKLKDLLGSNDIIHEKNELYENLNTLILSDKKAENIDSIVESTTKIVDYILNNKSRDNFERIDLPNSVITSLMVEKYNQKYSSLDESEKNILKTLISSDENGKKDMYSKLIRECIDLVNAKLNSDDLEIKDKLLKVKDKLLSDNQEINENFIKNISKLAELKNNLTSDL
jgi:hypothetical protein